MPRMSENQRQIDFILDVELYDIVEREAKKSGTSRGAIVRKILGKHFRVEPKVKRYTVEVDDESTPPTAA